MRQILLCVLILAFFVGVGSAATVTVGFSGDNADYTCDGSRDEVQINAALSAVAGTGGTVKLIGGHTYVVSSPIKIGDKSTLTGDSNAIIKLANDVNWDANVALIENSGSTGDITISGFEINGNYANNNEHGRGSYYYTLIDLMGVDDITIKNMYLHDNANDLIKLTNCDNVEIANNVGKNQGHEFVFLYLCDNARIYGNDIDIEVNAGIRCELSNYLDIYNNEIYSSSNSGYTGIYVQSYSRNYPVTSVDIHDNEIHNTDAAGIYVVALYKSSYPLNDKSQATGVTISNNLLYNTNTDNWDAPGGAISTAGFTGTVIENNVIYNSKNNGINIQYTYTGPSFDDVDYYIRDNIIMNCEGYAIYNSLGSTHNVVVQYNDLYGNSKGTTSGSGFSLSNNINKDPLFYNAGNADFHLKSTAGRWTGSSWTTDSVISPCIDAGNPSSTYGNEPSYNGGRVNIGAYGNTNEASKSVGTATSNEAPIATITSISPITAGEDESISFKGSGSDSDGSIKAYKWESSEDGTIGTSASFTTSELSTGIHTIYFSVRDDDGEWSKKVTSTVSVVANKDSSPSIPSSGSSSSSSLVISGISTASDKAYVENTLGTGENYYIDRNYKFTSVPSSYAGSSYIMTATEDRFYTQSDFLEFDVDQDVIVYVAYDDRTDTKPSWMTASFTDTGDDLIRDSTIRFSIYSRTYSAGHITLAGNSLESGEDGGMYVVIVKPADSSSVSSGDLSTDLVISDISAASDKDYVENTLGTGEYYYIDRSYEFTSIPSSYVGLSYIQTATQDRFYTQSDFLEFDINRDATVYIAYDDRTKTQPSWLSSFTDTGDDLVRDGTVTFSIYSRKYSAGHITLAGDSLPSNEDGGMYVVIVK